MRIITRGDFDGLVCALLLSEVEHITDIVLVHPKEAQDQLVPANSNDIVANLPYIRGCGMWFDHHVSHSASVPAQNTESGSVRGAFKLAPSCASVIRDYYGTRHRDEFKRYRGMIADAGRLDCADLLIDDILWPRGWILLGMTLDPRSGLGEGFNEYFHWLLGFLKTASLEEVLRHPNVVQRTDRLIDEMATFKALLMQHSRLDGKLVLTDFRGLRFKPAGNRFLVYAMFPDANVAVRIFDGHKGAVVVSVGRSIINCTCLANIGRFMRQYGGGGHAGAGAAQFPVTTAESRIAEIVDWLKNHDKRALALEWCRKNKSSPASGVTLSLYCVRKRTRSAAVLDFGLRIKSGRKQTKFSLQKETLAKIVSMHSGRKQRAGAKLNMQDRTQTALQQALPECAEQAELYARFLRKNKIRCKLDTKEFQ